MTDDDKPAEPKDKLDNLTARFLERLTPKERELLEKRFKMSGTAKSKDKK